MSSYGLHPDDADDMRGDGAASNAEDEHRRFVRDLDAGELLSYYTMFMDERPALAQEFGEWFMSLTARDRGHG